MSFGGNMDIFPLILFNEKVDRLERSGLNKRMATPKYIIQQDKITDRQWIAFDNISEDDLDAFVLNLRLLIQDRDGFSVRCLSKLYKENGVPKDLAMAFDVQRKKWKNYRSSPSLLIKPGGIEKLSNGGLFDILFYGGLAHLDKKYLNEFIILTTQGAFSAFVFGFFLMSLKTILNVLKDIRDINIRLIEVLKR
jgi:hypothetical protein